MLAALGGALEFHDFAILVFFTRVIAQLFFPPDTPNGLRQLQVLDLFAADDHARPPGVSGCCISNRSIADVPVAAAV